MENGTLNDIPKHLLRSYLPNGFPAPGEPVTDGDLGDILPRLLRGTAGLLGAIEVQEEVESGNKSLAPALRVLAEQLYLACWLLERWQAIRGENLAQGSDEPT
jgi:hypothetical protein